MSTNKNQSLAQLIQSISLEIRAFQGNLDQSLGSILAAAPEEVEGQKELAETLQYLVGMLRDSAKVCETRSQKLGLIVRCSKCHKVVEFVGKSGRWPVRKEGQELEAYVVKHCSGCRSCEGIFCFDCAKSKEQACRQS